MTWKDWIGFIFLLVQTQEKTRGRRVGEKGSYLRMSPTTGKQEGDAFYYHMPDSQTGRLTVMKTDE